MSTNLMDKYFKTIVCNVERNGTKDINPRPKYEDGTPAHTYSINHATMTFDLSKGEFPALTLRPIAFKSSIKEILWIYKDQSNDLKLLRDKYGVHWWDQWALDDDTIGQCYGASVRRHHLMDNLLDGLEKEPDGRRHIMSLWQDEDFKEPHALKPCCFMTIWNIRHEEDGDYLDMMMIQRSCDFMLAGSTSNQVQYATLLCMVAHHLGITPGKYTWVGDNVQIYDRHFAQANEMLSRKLIPCECYIKINPEKKTFWDIDVDDIELIGYPLSTVKEVNPQLKFDIGI